MPTSIYSLNYDILLEIFHQLSLHAISGPYSFERSRERVSVAERVIRRQTLAGAALVCRAFADPASKVLWSAYFNGNMRILLELLSVCKKIPEGNRRKVYVSQHSTRLSSPSTRNKTGLWSLSTAIFLLRSGLFS